MTERRKKCAKGRASAARPFACVALVLLFASLLGPTGAQAATLKSLILTETTPPSPSTISHPLIHGEVDEGGATKVVGSGGVSVFFPPRAMSLEPENTVKIYTDSKCEGAPVAESKVETLEGVGIEVEVAPGSVTTFYAKQFKGAEESLCSTPGLSYRQVKTAPAPPVFSAVNPASPANDNFPRLLGTADPDAVVSIFPSADCSGAAVTGSGAEFASPGIQVSVADNSETTFSAEAVLAGLSSGCSEQPIAYREVTPPPETGGGGGSGGGGGTGGPTQPAGSPPAAPRIHTVPGGVSNDDTPFVTGSAPGATTVKVFAAADCSGPVVAKGPVSQFGSPGLQVQVAANAVTVLSAVSVADGGQSACSNAVQYTEDSTPPHTRITMGPAAKTRHRKVVFRFLDTTGGAPGTAFFCKVDKTKWRPCSSPLRLRHLRRTRHTVEVKATDPASNAETKPAKRRFKVVP